MRLPARRNTYPRYSIKALFFDALVYEKFGPTNSGANEFVDSQMLTIRSLALEVSCESEYGVLNVCIRMRLPVDFHARSFQCETPKARASCRIAVALTGRSFHNAVPGKHPLKLGRSPDMPIFNDNAETIGRTPLVRINRLAKGLPATVLAKTEGRNPAYSVKCRIGAAMIWDAEKRGVLKPGMQVVEPTSGNTGIALAYVCAAKGYPLTLVMPDTMSVERRMMLKAFGATVLLTPGADGMKGAINKATEMSEDANYFMPQQFNNPANPEIHFKTTGPEIFNDTEGKVDIFISGVGTGGTITGVSRYFKQEKNHPLHCIAVEPTGSPVLSGGEPGKHKIQGLGAGFIPEILDTSLIDEVVQVTDEESFAMAPRIATEEGITCGISSGAAMAAALKVAAREENKGKTIVVILPDSGERYLSTPLFDAIRE